jgi:hypothetical protein
MILFLTLIFSQVANWPAEPVPVVPDEMKMDGVRMQAREWVIWHKDGKWMSYLEGGNQLLGHENVSMSLPSTDGATA